MTAVPNLGFGIQVRRNGDRIGQVISAACTDEDCGRNVISGNRKSNILLDIGSTGAFVWGNFIGTDKTGTAALPNNNVQGVQDKSIGSTIGGVDGVTPGGACTGQCNVISGNAGNFESVGNAGIVVTAGASGTRIWGNFIGTDVTGTQQIGNGTSGFSAGIISHAPDVIIGGTMPEMRNVVSGNVGQGIFMSGINGFIQGNYVGTNSAGTEAIPSSGVGIYLDMADSTLIGGTSAGAANVISGASAGGSYGVEILRSTNIQVVGNLIGVAANGSTPLPNSGYGVIIFDESSNNIVGGAAIGAGNTIAYNVAGVVIDGEGPPVRSNTIRGNSIYSNIGAGISLVRSSNDSILPPVITGLNPVHGTACAQCTVEIFSDSEDEGAIFEGSVFSDVSGAWTFNGPVSGPYVTATNTDTSNNTSAFSAPVPVEPRTQGDIDCNDFINLDDFQFLLKHAAESNGLHDGATPSELCPDLGQPDGISGFGWGDLNCDGFVDAVDALYELVYLSGAMQLPQMSGCTPIGQPILGTVPDNT